MPLLLFMRLAKGGSDFTCYVGSEALDGTGAVELDPELGLELQDDWEKNCALFQP